MRTTLPTTIRQRFKKAFLFPTRFFRSCRFFFLISILLFCVASTLMASRALPVNNNNNRPNNAKNSKSPNISLHKMLSSRLRAYEVIDVKASPLPSRRALALVLRRHRRDVSSSSAIPDWPQLHMKVSIYAHDLKIIFIPKRSRPADNGHSFVSGNGAGRYTRDAPVDADADVYTDHEEYVDDDEYSPDVFVSFGKYSYQIRMPSYPTPVRGIVVGMPDAFVSGMLYADGIFSGVVNLPDDELYFERIMENSNNDDTMHNGVSSASEQQHSENGQPSDGGGSRLGNYMQNKRVRDGNDLDKAKTLVYKGTDVIRIKGVPIDGSRVQMPSLVSNINTNGKPPQQPTNIPAGLTANGGTSRIAASQQDVANGRICQVTAVADYKYFSEHCQFDAALCAARIDFLLTVVDKIWRDQDFNYDGVPEGYSAHTTNVVVISNLENDPHYLYMDHQGENNPREYLFRASQAAQYLPSTNTDANGGGQSCLTVWFTHYDFGYIIGMAHPGVFMQRENQLSGVCSQSYLNQVLITGFSGYDTQIHKLIPEYVDVIAHEIGHTFGADHDPHYSPDCSPGGILGVHLLFPVVVSREMRAIEKLSKCTKDAVQGHIGVIKSTPYFCFQPYRQRNGDKYVCGNYRIEPGEQCDCGGTLHCEQYDHCCTDKCRLTTTAICSASQRCCTDKCTLQPAGYVCQEETECNEVAVCDGQHAECTVVPKSDFTPCKQNAGLCHKGRCEWSRCALNNLRPCQCVEPFQTVDIKSTDGSTPPEGESRRMAFGNACKLCCMGNDGHCRPAVMPGGSTIQMPRSSWCNENNGTCIDYYVSSDEGKTGGEQQTEIACMNYLPPGEDSFAIAESAASVDASTGPCVAAELFLLTFSVLFVSAMYSLLLYGSVFGVRSRLLMLSVFARTAAAYV